SKTEDIIPLRGSNFVLDDYSCVIQMLGAKEMKTKKHGTSDPLLIHIRTPHGKYNISNLESYLFIDLAYIVQQIYSFTYLSWRSFLPGEQPATILYSDLIA